MKICINYGHALNGAGTGAVGIKKESEETRAVGKELVRLLKENSLHQIFIADFEGEDNYVKSTKFANDNNVDLFVSVHFNSGAGDMNGNVNNISKLGFKNRGIKERPDLYVLKNTRMGACLVECAFLDDMDDMKLYNPKLMAKAIAEGILNKIINEESVEDDKFFKVCIGAYKNRESAVEMRNEAIAKGFKDTYMIYE